MRAYSELEAGRFFVLADFEEENAANSVELVNASGKAATKIDPRRGKPDTGGAALEFRTASDADTIVFAGTGDASGYFKRDWRPYDELMMSVFSPVDGARLHLGLGAGRGGELHSVFMQIPLAKGWNTPRVDLAELEGNAPLDDMRELRLSVAGVRKPVALRIDDVLLTRSRTDLMGDSSNTQGGLYVQQVASHWNIGAGGHFELTFMNGQVTRWYNLAVDPHRIRNLVEGTTLGPTPVTVNPTTGEHAPLVSPGAPVRVDQRLMEMSPVRVVVAVDWFGSADSPATKTEPLLSFQHAIYPTGQVYTMSRVAAGVQTEDVPRGLMVSMGAANESDVQVETPAVTGQNSFFAVRHVAANATLAFVPASSGRLIHTYDADTRQLSLLLVQDFQDAPLEWSCHLYLGNDDEAGPQNSADRAADYLTPAKVEFLIGAAADPANSSGERRTADGFDLAEGCYRVKPDEGRVRLRLDGGGRPLFSPAFCVESAGRPGWMYLKHLIHQPVAVSADGALVFQLPNEVRETRLVEVVLEASSSTSLP